MSINFSDEDLEQYLFELQEEKENYLFQIESMRHRCHEHLELRVRKIGTGRHYAMQCMKCGEQRGQFLKPSKALEINNNREPPPFDLNIETEIKSKKHQLSQSLCDIYSEENKVNALINGCGTTELLFEKKKQYSMQTDERLAELLMQLDLEVGVGNVAKSLVRETVLRKKKLYEERLAKTDRFISEGEIKKWIKSSLKRDFFMYEEVKGVHIATKKIVQIDFVFYPKPHLIEAGFVNEPFGIEAKYIKQEKGFTRKMSRGVWQAMSYNECKFKIGQQEIKLKFSLLFSNLSFKAETALLMNLGHEYENDLVEMRGMLSIANHARVGMLNISGNKKSCKGWSMTFGGGTYFSCSTFNDNVKYNLSDPNTISTVRVGNF